MTNLRNRGSAGYEGVWGWSKLYNKISSTLSAAASCWGQSFIIFSSEKVNWQVRLQCYEHQKQPKGTIICALNLYWCDLIGGLRHCHAPRVSMGQALVLKYCLRPTWSNNVIKATISHGSTLKFLLNTIVFCHGSQQLSLDDSPCHGQWVCNLGFIGWCSPQDHTGLLITMTNDDNGDYIYLVLFYSNGQNKREYFRQNKIDIKGIHNRHLTSHLLLVINGS